MRLLRYAVVAVLAVAAGVFFLPNAASAHGAMMMPGSRTYLCYIDGLQANLARALALAESSPSIVTPLNRIIGYEAAAKIAKHSVAQGMTVRDAVIDLGFVERGEVTLEQLDSALDVLSMTRPPQA